MVTPSGPVALTDAAQVRVIGRTRVGSGAPYAIAITLRYNRNAVLGDKFSSRHGQKGVLSQLWNQVDMPFTGKKKPKKKQPQNWKSTENFKGSAPYSGCDN